MVFVHLFVRDWSLSVLKEMLKVFATFRQCVTTPVFAVGDLEDAKWATFVSLFGFKPLQEVDCTDGTRRQLFIHIKDALPNVEQADSDKQPD